MNIAIRGTAPAVLVEINDTKIHDGKQFDPQRSHSSNGVDIQLVNNILNITLRIFNCNLQRNQGGNFQLGVDSNNNIMTPDNNSIFTILIDNSTFSMSDGHGVGIKCTLFGSCGVYSIIDITLRRSSFLKNNESGLILIYIYNNSFENRRFHI